ncbi:asparagine synthase (glutamine-hydrolyzing) [Streptomyces sp. NPDC021100]|uniref:asparagine synthase (glutamine-hydrolyzing) n=1 Tax=Streptomyces sp. NPDC021100 TaxID=3365114 RepID=UPI0037B0270F
MTTVFSGCGIAGALHYGLPDPARETPGAHAVTAMTDALAHRGPHGAGLWQRPGVVLGHRRLAITDLGPAGAQPMTRDHLTITYNGEVYNTPQLAQELSRFYAFTSATDTEVVLRAWQHWGPRGALQRMEGMFAFALWDEHQRCLYLVRDAVGIKPLYYHRASGFVLFASEVEALMASRHVPRRPDTDVLARHLLCSSTLPPDRTRTLVRDVAAVPAGTFLTLHPDGRRHATTYWTLPHTAAPEHAPVDADRGEELRELLARGVTQMLTGDVPVAAFLSGGLDSSALTALAAAAAAEPVPCITTAPPPTAPAGEASTDLRFSRLLAAALSGRVHHHLAVQQPELTLEDLDTVCDLAALGDDPRHVTIARNYRTVHELGLRVVLNGQGADEVLGGYVSRPTFYRHILDVRAPDPRAIRTLPGSRQIPGLSPAVLALRTTAHQEVLDFHAGLPGPALERAHRLLFHTQLQRILQFEDFLAMRSGVEARFPYLDRRLTAWAFTQPFHHHIRPDRRQGKIHLAAAMRGHLPTAILHRPKAVFPHQSRGPLQAALSRLATAHAAELREDPLINHLFALPSALAEAPVSILWPVLSLWRWHHKLHHPTPPLSGPRPEPRGELVR